LRLVITGGLVVTPLDLLDDCDVVIEDGLITGVGPGLAAHGAGETIDARGRIVAPGFIDIHVHGSAGHDTMDGTAEAIEGMARFFASHGVTAFCPTTMTMPAEDIMRAVEAVHECQCRPMKGAQPIGVHLEGPYIDAGRKGAQPEQYVRTARSLDYRGFFSLGNVRLISLAPELDENKELIGFARSRGASVAVGHSSANYQQVEEAVRLGLNQATHTFNQMEGLHHRKPGTVGAALLLDGIYAQLIADGIHLHPAVVDMVVRLKGPEKAVLITDAIRGAGMPNGEYELGGQPIVVKDGAVRLADGTLAGSCLTLDAAVRNVLEFTDCELADALQMATLTPARSIGLAHRKGSLEPGKDADVVLLDQALEVVTTIVMGEVAYCQ
jgi:N-acetylglucosamine-6-phosphate deacetylase